MKKIFLMFVLFVATVTLFGQVRLSKNPKNQTEILNEQYCSGLFKSTDGTIIDIANENVSAFLNILDWLEGRVAGLQVFVARNGARIPVIRGSVASIYVDQMPTD